MRFLVQQRSEKASGETLLIESNQILLGVNSRYPYLMPGLDFNLAITLANSKRLKVSAKGGFFTLRGKKFKSKTLRIGDELNAGFYTVSTSQGQSPDDVCLVITRNPILPACERSAMTFAQTGLSMRFWSYSLLILMLVGMFLLPFLDTLGAAPFADTSVQPLVPTERFWSAGPLHSAHVTAGIENDCKACHSQAFEVIPDSACLACHDQINEHVALTSSNSPHFLDSSCASCHIEHMEPSYLVNRSSKLCVDCHGKLQDWAPEMPIASKFSAFGHPEFRASVWEYDAASDAAAQWKLLKPASGATQTVSEQSNLKFPHDTHMNAEKMATDNNGVGLACVNCHEINPVDGGVRVISMETHCQSCHELTYDLDDPALLLPHGPERQVVAELESHFYRKSRASKTFDARERVRKEAEHQFSDSGCVTCHVVKEYPENPIENRWQVVPVRISQDWYPAASFNHTAHMSAPGISSDSNSCIACHAADKSHDSSDILMPQKETCLACHSSERGSSANACISCHVFHAKDGTPSLEARDSLRHFPRSAVHAVQ